MNLQAFYSHAQLVIPGEDARGAFQVGAMDVTAIELLGGGVVVIRRDGVADTEERRGLPAKAPIVTSLANGYGLGEVEPRTGLVKAKPK